MGQMLQAVQVIAAHRRRLKTAPRTSVLGGHATMDCLPLPHGTSWVSLRVLKLKLAVWGGRRNMTAIDLVAPRAGDTIYLSGELTST